jgi:signal transduction histidine kinase
MIAPKNPINEEVRVRELHSFKLLDTLPEQSYDEITALAAFITGKPISLITLIDEDRQFFKSRHGVVVTETPREYSFCAHAINSPDELMTVPNTEEDERFKDNPLVINEPHIKFYAGMPLVTDSGFALGTLCVLDNQPGTISEDQIKALKFLSNQVMRLMESNLRRIELEEKQKIIELRNEEIAQIIYAVSHDLNAPLGTIKLVLNELMENECVKNDDEAVEYITLSNSVINRAHTLIQELLEFSRLHRRDMTKQHISIRDLFKSVLENLKQSIMDKQATVELVLPDTTVFCHVSSCIRLFQNLIHNSIKFTSPDKNPYIQVFYEESNIEWSIQIKDNGTGISADKLSYLFIPFKRFHDTNEYPGTGLGMASAKKIAELHQGSISASSEEGVGTTITVTIPKL